MKAPTESVAPQPDERCERIAPIARRGLGAATTVAAAAILPGPAIGAPLHIAFLRLRGGAIAAVPCLMVGIQSVHLQLYPLLVSHALLSYEAKQWESLLWRRIC